MDGWQVVRGAGFYIYERPAESPYFISDADSLILWRSNLCGSLCRFTDKVN